MHDAPVGKGGGKRGKRRRQFADAPGDLGFGRHIHVVLGKIDAGFEQCDKVNQRPLHRPHAPAERTAHLAGCLTSLGERLRLDQVAHGFGLSQVQPAGQEGALSELARLSQPRTQLQGTAKQQLQNHR